MMYECILYLFLGNSCSPLSIPSNGPLPWQFNDVLVQAIETNTLAHHESRFTRACGRHLLKLRPEKRTKSEYNIYSKMIVDQFPHFKHENSKDGNWVNLYGLLIFCARLKCDFNVFILLLGCIQG